MPYKDPEKQRQAMKRIMCNYRRRNSKYVKNLIGQVKEDLIQLGINLNKIDWI